jgi:hypothetical protein
MFNDDSGPTLDQINTIQIIVKVFSSISLLANIVVFIIFGYFKEIRTFYHEVICWFSLSSAIYSITSFLPFDCEDTGFWCAVQSITLTWFQHSGYVWSAIIGYTGFISVIKRDHLEKHRVRYRVIFLIMAFIVSGLMSTM